MKQKIIIFLLFIQLVNAVEITEIMYNPSGSDSYYEYLKLYSEQQNNISRYYFEGIDLTFNESYIEGYFVVCKNKEKFLEMYNYECDEEFSGSLLNTGETITLYNSQGEKIDEVTYENTAKEGESISKENAWHSTPQNNLSGNADDLKIIINETQEINITLNETTINETANETNETFNQTILNLTVNETSENFTINETFANISTNTTTNITNIKTNETNTNITFNQTNKNENISINETINLTNTTTNETTEKDYTLIIKTDKELYENGEQISIDFQFNEHIDEFIIEYRIEDLFGNVIKKRWNTTNLNTKHYTPNINEKDKIMIIKAYLYVKEYDINTSNNYYEKKLFVKNDNYIEETEKEIKTTTKSSSGGSSGSKTSSTTKNPIKSFYTLAKKLDEGKEITLRGSLTDGEKAYITNGNKTEELIIENGKFEHKTNLTSENPKYILEIYKDGQKIDQKELSLNITKQEEEINHFLSDEKQENNTESVINQKKSQIQEPHKVELYESENEKSKKIINYIMLGLSILFNVILIWKR